MSLRASFLAFTVVCAGALVACGRSSLDDEIPHPSGLGGSASHLLGGNATFGGNTTFGGNATFGGNGQLGGHGGNVTFGGNDQLGGHGGNVTFGGHNPFGGNGQGGSNLFGGNGQGGATACASANDCNDGNFCTSDFCSAGVCVFGPRDVDGDGFTDAQCGGNDCDDSRPNVHPGLSEQCGDTLDNDCNGLVDCADPACFDTQFCPCLPGAKEICTGGFDEDCDGQVDCTDSDCAGDPACQCQPFETSCSDGVDNNCNKLVDCGDPQCFGDPACQTCAPSETSCTDTVDNDCDGAVDCADADCAGFPGCGCQKAEICGNGVDDDCNGAIDCLDPACKEAPSCGTCLPSEVTCDDGVDDDCDGAIDCADTDCSASVACSCQIFPEDCGNHTDDNCNGLIDCADPSCAHTFACTCPGGFPTTEICDNGVDDDCDGAVDCADTNCLGNAACSMCKPEICNDGVDNDCDGAIDCKDSACALDPSCGPPTELCNNGVDDDFDGLIDCNDPDCKTNQLCLTKQSSCQVAKRIDASGTYTGDTTGNLSTTSGSCGGDAGEAVFSIVVTVPTKAHFDTDGTTFDSVLYLRSGNCNQGRELACNDDDHPSNEPPPASPSVAEIDFTILYPGTYFVFLDGFTINAMSGQPDSGPFTLNVDLQPNPPEICGNGIDDDGDGYADCGDSDCAGPACACNGFPAGPEYGPQACTNGIDDDCDGAIDAADSDCTAGGTKEQCDGQDNNGNQIVDDFSCRCANDGDCAGEPPGYICFTQTARSCAPPCDQFIGFPGGGVCSFIAPGSVCNPSSGQCVFP